MKKIVTLILVFAMLCCLAACGVRPVPDNNIDAPTQCLETDKVKVDGFYVDESYVESDGSPLKMVYVFLTFKPAETNYQVDAKYTDLIIGANTYSSDFYKNTCRYMPSYYYSSFVEDVYVGTECKLALTFKVPEGDLQAGKDVTLSDSSMPLDGLRFSTDDLVRCANVEEIGSKADAAGYAALAEKRKPADEATKNKVANAINGYYFEFYVTLGTSLTKYELEFFSPNKFEVRTPYLTNDGTYEVRKGYIFLNYTTSDTPVEIHYEFKNGEISLDCNEGFSIYE